MPGHVDREAANVAALLAKVALALRRGWLAALGSALLLGSLGVGLAFVTLHFRFARICCLVELLSR